jgi:hypothetical protein
MLAGVYRQYNRDKSLLALEQEARGARRGLWTDPNPTPPWEYRHGGKPSLSSVRRSMSEVDASSSGGRQCGQHPMSGIVVLEPDEVGDIGGGTHIHDIIELSFDKQARERLHDSALERFPDDDFMFSAFKA